MLVNVSLDVRSLTLVMTFSTLSGIYIQSANLVSSPPSAKITFDHLIINN